MAATKKNTEDIGEQSEPPRFHNARDKWDAVKQAIGLGTNWEARYEAYAREGLLGDSPDPEVEDAKE